MHTSLLTITNRLVYHGGGCWRSRAPWGPTQRGKILTGFTDFHLASWAITWPRLLYMCQTRSTAAHASPAFLRSPTLRPTRCFTFLKITPAPLLSRCGQPSPLGRARVREYNPGPDSGLDCLTCAILACQRLTTSPADEVMSHFRSSPLSTQRFTV